MFLLEKQVVFSYQKNEILGFGGKINFTFWWKNDFLPSFGKMSCVFARNKDFFLFRHENEIFCFGGKMIFCVLVGK